MSKSEFIKRPNLVENYTQEQVVEIARCMNDPIYFMKTFMKVQHPVKGSIPFILYEYQETAVRAFLNNTYVCVKIGRQQGKTAVIAGYLLWFACFRAEKYVLVASKDNDAAMDVLNRIRFSYEELPMWLKPGCVYFNRHEISFDNGSTIKSSATTENTGRGRSISCVSGSTRVVLRSKETGQIFMSTLRAIYNASSSKMNTVHGTKILQQLEITDEISQNCQFQISITAL
jgi:hypothetical protein